jgi:hypothetical protein
MRVVTFTYPTTSIFEDNFGVEMTNKSFRLSIELYVRIPAFKNVSRDRLRKFKEISETVLGWNSFPPSEGVGFFGSNVYCDENGSFSGRVENN